MLYPTELRARGFGTSSVYGVWSILRNEQLSEAPFEIPAPQGGRRCSSAILGPCSLIDYFVHSEEAPVYKCAHRDADRDTTVPRETSMTSFGTNSGKNFGAYQDEIYFAGLTGTLPKLPVDFAALEKRAHAAMPPSLVSYVAGGCGDEHTQRANVAGFEHWGLIPRMLAARPVRDLSIKLFGMELAAPIFMAPIGVLGLCYLAASKLPC